MKLKRQKLIVAIVMFSLVFMYGFVPNLTEAASLEVARDTISDSDVSATGVTHTIFASTTQAIGAAGYFEVVFDSNITGVNSANVTCPSAGVAGGSGNTITCTYAGGLAAGPYTITMTSAVNPAAIGSYLVHVRTRTAGAAEVEHSSVRIAIVNDVTVTATVEATLTFFIGGLATSSEVNGELTTGSSTSQTLAFGTLEVATSSTLGQQLRVTTNAYYGYSVTVFQDHNLLANNGADIDAFVDGTAASTTAQSWAAPTGTLGSENTYGHFGVASDDSTLTGGDAFGADAWKGFDNTDPIQVMYHTGPADGSTDDIGSTTVAYRIEINALQEAGDYSNTLTYICTPTY
jgi:hypothetical protein